jgi:hypothetical protein
MPALWHDDYTSIYNLVSDFIDFEGGNVSNLALDTINRAVQNLVNRRNWDFLVKDAALTITNKTGSLPSDLGKIIQVYHDSDGDGMPDWYYYRNSKRDDHRYTVDYGFAKATGYAPTITFADGPQSTPRIKYQVYVDKFTGTGTEYSAFPANVVIAETMMLHAAEKGWNDGEYALLKDSWAKTIRDFEQAHQYQNNEPRQEVTDDNGDMVTQDDFGLDGDYDRGQGRYENSYDLG